MQDDALRRIPEDPRRLVAPLRIDVDGHVLEVAPRKYRRRASSGALVRRHIQARARGLPMSTVDLYEDETTVRILVDRNLVGEARWNPGGMLSLGRLVDRSLRELVRKAAVPRIPGLALLPGGDGPSTPGKP